MTDISMVETQRQQKFAKDVTIKAEEFAYSIRDVDPAMGLAAMLEAVIIVAVGLKWEDVVADKLKVMIGLLEASAKNRAGKAQ